MIKQKKIATMLRVVCGLLAVMGLCLFGGLTWYKLSIGSWFHLVEDSHNILLGLSILIAVLCYTVLYQFWKVVGEIEKDNSFSLENATSFHNMAICGLLAGIDYILRIAYFLVSKVTEPMAYVYATACVLIAIIFWIVCESLSQLIRNAYEMKLENDLTI